MSTDEADAKNLFKSLERANDIILWMAPYIGKMCTPPHGISDLNEHWLLMERLVARGLCKRQKDYLNRGKVTRR